MLNKSILTILLSVAVITVATSSSAEEGMWTFDNPPINQLQDHYGFQPTQAWLNHVRLSSVRLNDGGSGSFVSPNGLLLTNHHVARNQLQKNSTPEHDYVQNGFYAATPELELKTPDLEVNVLVSMENVTDKVQAAVKDIKDQNKALQVRQAIIAQIERESTEKTGLRSDVVTLYQGGEYWLYRYKKYTDVRLVFAPEQQAAFYGGDPDNFTYPRYDLDMALFRVYENGKPLNTTNYLKWNAKGAAEGELIFVPGHPGATSRQYTMAQLITERDFREPVVIASIRSRIAALRQYAAQGQEQARQVNLMIFTLANALKVYQGRYEALMDKQILAKKQTDEDEFRQRVAATPQWQAEFGNAWNSIAEAEQKARPLIKQQYFRRVDSQLVILALQLVQYVTEVKRPDGDRLPQFHEAGLESLRFRLLSPAPIYPEVEKVRLTASLTESLKRLGPNDEFIKDVLGNSDPETIARQLVEGTKLADPKVRQALLEGGEQAIAASNDPMIVLARKLDPIVRAQIKQFDEQINSVEVAAGEKLGHARFLVYGKSTYPDATFTLRLSYGSIKGYPMNGTVAPPKTTFYGLYDRAASFDNKGPFALPKSYATAKDKLDLATPLNFISTADIIGGNSGSPVINKNAELVGLIFDGNIESLAGDFVYEGEKNRAIAVHSTAMIEALRKLYGAGKLADELEGKQQSQQ
jgi:Peptidase S46